MLQQIRCKAYQFYSFLVLLVSKFIIVEDLTTLPILPTFIYFVLMNFMTCKGMRSHSYMQEGLMIAC